MEPNFRLTGFLKVNISCRIFSIYINIFKLVLARARQSIEIRKFWSHCSISFEKRFGWEFFCRLKYIFQFNFVEGHWNKVFTSIFVVGQGLKCSKRPRRMTRGRGIHYYVHKQLCMYVGSIGNIPKHPVPIRGPRVVQILHRLVYEWDMF
jgi:hypothetical protein